MWQLKFVYEDCISGEECSCILKFNDELKVWKYYTDFLSLPNVLAVYKPYKSI